MIQDTHTQHRAHTFHHVRNYWNYSYLQFSDEPQSRTAAEYICTFCRNQMCRHRVPHFSIFFFFVFVKVLWTEIYAFLNRMMVWLRLGRRTAHIAHRAIEFWWTFFILRLPAASLSLWLLFLIHVWYGTWSDAAFELIDCNRNVYGFFVVAILLLRVRSKAHLTDKSNLNLIHVHLPWTVNSTQRRQWFLLPSDAQKSKTKWLSSVVDGRGEASNMPFANPHHACHISVIRNLIECLWWMGIYVPWDIPAKRNPIDCFRSNNKYVPETK